MLAGLVMEVGQRVAGEDQRRVRLVSPQDVGGRVLARIEPRVAASEVHGKRIPGAPGHDIVGAGDITMSAIRLADKTRVPIEIPGQGQQGFGVGVLAAGHCQSHAEEHDTELGGLHSLCQILPRREGLSGFLLDQLRIQFDTADQCSEGPDRLEIGAWLDL